MPATNITCPQIYYVEPLEVNGVSVDMRNVLRQGEVLTGTPTVTATDPTITSPAVSTAVLLINEESVEPGKAVTFTVTGGNDGSDYSILVSCNTSANRLRRSRCILKVRVPTVTAP